MNQEYIKLGKSDFLVSGKDFSKFVAAAIISTVLFGLIGLIYIICLQWLTRNTYSVSEAAKHGISSLSASRLGGLSIFIFMTFLVILGWLQGQDDFIQFNNEGQEFFALFAFLGCFALGLVEDFKNNSLSYKFRLSVELVIFLIIISIWPVLIPVGLNIPIIEDLIKLPFVGLLLTVIFCTGFVNSMNMADGANGLVPGIITIAFGIFYLETSQSLYALAMTGCGLFCIFNVISGRIFMGDAGSYGLGSFLVISSLYLFSNKIFSAGFLACLFFYPCVDFLVSIVRRKVAGRSIFMPDNDHLHNRLHHYFKRWFDSNTLANSLTGIAILSFTSGLLFVGYIFDWWPLQSQSWVWLFLFQCSLYTLLFIVSGVNRTIIQYVVDN